MGLNSFVIFTIIYYINNKLCDTYKLIWCYLLNYLFHFLINYKKSNKVKTIWVGNFSQIILGKFQKLTARILQRYGQL